MFRLHGFRNGFHVLWNIPLPPSQGGDKPLCQQERSEESRQYQVGDTEILRRYAPLNDSPELTSSQNMLNNTPTIFAYSN